MKISLAEISMTGKGRGNTRPFPVDKKRQLFFKEEAF